MKQLDIFDVFKELNNAKSEQQTRSKNDVDCEFYKQGKCYAIETKEEPCIHCWLCQK